MSSLSDRAAALPPDKRAILEARLAATSSRASSRTSIRPRAADIDEIPLSFAQERLWFLDQLQPGSSVYSIPASIPWLGLLDPEALRRALNHIVDRHEALRTTFEAAGGRPAQRVAARLELDLPLTRLDKLPPEEQEHELTRLATDEAQRPFDLARGPLLRASLVRLDRQHHILLLNMHHIISDEWSLGVLFGELTSLYQDLCAGRPPSLPPLEIQYPDFTLWQREHLQGRTLDRLLEYWRRQLDGAAPALGLVTDRPRRPDQTLRGKIFSFRLSNRALEGIRLLGQQHGATTFMALLACFKALLFRYTAQNDIVVGAPIANRSAPELEPLIGFFVNTLVLRSRVDSRMSFRQLLEQVKTVTLGAYAHQDIPFARLVAELAPRRDLGVSPFFQVMLSMLSTTPGPGSSSGDGRQHEHQVAGPAPPEMRTGTAKFDLTLSVVEAGDGLAASFEYATDLFDDQTIVAMARHLSTLIDGVCSDPDQRISRLPILSEPERRQLLTETNETAAEYPAGLCIHELLEQQVERAPAAPAIVEGDRCLSYRQLDQRANQVAQRLVELGAGAEARIGVCMRRSTEAIVAMLGVMKAGSAYVPIDPELPPRRASYILDNASISTVLIDPGSPLRSPIADQGATVLEAGEGAFESLPGDRVAARVDPQSLAYIIYTSGSTGRPKGVMVPHAGVCNGIAWAQRVYPLSHDDGVLQKTSLSFDVSVWEIFWSLCSGARLVIAAPEEHKDIGYLIRTINEQQITVLYLVNSMMPFFLEANGLEACDSLRLVIQTGEQMAPGVPRRLYQSLGAELLNLYGPTECTVEASYWQAPRDHDGSQVPIGRPIANTQLYVLDSELEPVPHGVVGEVYIGGINLTRGYAGNPRRTAESFIANPFARSPGERLYQTGDLGRLLPDGTTLLLGRVDLQVKIRGFRIELGEVESVLRRHEEIRESVVVAREDLPGDQRLVAYIVATNGSEPGSAELRRFLARSLPDYMIPAAFICLPELPYLSSGKVNRQALPAPDWRSGSRADRPSSPPTSDEATMAELWRQVLAVDRVEVDDDFFDLGGHSLLATVVVSRIRDLYGVELTVASLFEAPTVRELTRKVADELTLQQETSSATTAPITSLDPQEALENLGDLSDEQVDEMLRSLLDGQEEV